MRLVLILFALLTTSCDLSSTGESWEVEVDYSKSIHQMLAAAGNDTTLSFQLVECYRGLVPERKKMFVQMKLVSLPSEVNDSEHAAEYMKSLGLAPATIYELLAFSAAHPELQRQRDIIALWSPCDVSIRDRVPYLTGDYNHRYVFLIGKSAIWQPGSMFLAVRKE